LEDIDSFCALLYYQVGWRDTLTVFILFVAVGGDYSLFFYFFGG
jgi:hypothetical protein